MTPKPCWILCLPRTGSSYLCELLNNTGLFPDYHDPRLTRHIGPIQLGRAFNEWLRIFDNPGDLAENPPPCCKAIYHQYVEVMGSIPKVDRRTADPGGYREIDRDKELFVRHKYHLNYVKAILPGVRFVNLTRNPVSQAVSTYCARHSATYHLYNDQQRKDYFDREIPIDRRKLIDVFEEVAGLRGVWDDLCRWQHVLDVDYDRLVDRPGDVLSDVLGFLDAAFDGKVIAGALYRTESSRKRLHRMTRPEAERMSRIIRGHSGLP